VTGYNGHKATKFERHELVGNSLRREDQGTEMKLKKKTYYAYQMEVQTGRFPKEFTGVSQRKFIYYRISNVMQPYTGIADFPTFCHKSPITPVTLGLYYFALLHGSLIIKMQQG